MTRAKLIHERDRAVSVVYRATRHDEDRRYVAQGTPGPLVQEGGGEYVLSLADLFRVVWSRAWLILLLAILFAGAAMAYDVLVQEPEYEASIKVLIIQEQGGAPSSLGTETQGLQDAALTMTEAVETRSVADGVIARLGLSMTSGELLGNLSAEQSTDTLFIDAFYTDTDPQRAQRIADALGEEFSEKVAETGLAGSSLRATVWDPAAVSPEPVSPKPLRDAALAFVLGAMLGVALAFVLEQLDDSWRSPEELEHVSGVPTFGVIPEFKMAKPKGKD